MATHLRSLADSKTWALHQIDEPSQDWGNLCQSFSRQTFGRAAFGVSARVAFNDAPDSWKVLDTSVPPPPGTIAYYGNADRGFGHATPVLGRRGLVASNDIKRAGRIDLAHYTAFPAVWGLPYRGYLVRTAEGPLPVGEAPQPAPPVALNVTVELPLIWVAAARLHGPRTTTYLKFALHRQGFYKPHLQVSAADEFDGGWPDSLQTAYDDFRSSALGWTGADVTGLPGRASLVQLGARSKVFGVRPGDPA